MLLGDNQKERKRAALPRGSQVVYLRPFSGAAAKSLIRDRTPVQKSPTPPQEKNDLINSIGDRTQHRCWSVGIGETRLARK